MRPLPDRRREHQAAVGHQPAGAAVDAERGGGPAPALAVIPHLLDGVVGPGAATATARQMSASRPRIAPWLSGREKPGDSPDTPQTSCPRALTTSSVGDPVPACARTGPARSAPSRREAAKSWNSKWVMGTTVSRSYSVGTLAALPHPANNPGWAGCERLDGMPPRTMQYAQACSMAARSEPRRWDADAHRAMRRQTHRLAVQPQAWEAQPMASSAIPPPSGAATVRVITARDDDISGLFPTGFESLYEVHSYRNAARILATSCKPEFDEIVGALMGFQILTEDIVAGGGNKSRIAIAMEERLKPLGWLETRITGDLQVRRVTRIASDVAGKGPKTAERVDLFQIPGFVDGHKVDFVKGRVAFDMEWNSKDQTFDRDLYAVRAFYDCNLVTAGVLLTRSADLVPLFEEIATRRDVAGFKSKFGASTTWMRKLTYRLDAGRAGGCPILALGIRPAVVADFEEWKRRYPVKRAVSPLSIEDATGDDAADPG